MVTYKVIRNLNPQVCSSSQFKVQIFCYLDLSDDFFMVSACVILFYSFFCCLFFKSGVCQLCRGAEGGETLVSVTCDGVCVDSQLYQLLYTLTLTRLYVGELETFRLSVSTNETMNLFQRNQPKIYIFSHYLLTRMLFQTFFRSIIIQFQQ